MAGHLRRIVVEDAADNLLWDVPVDHPSAEGVSPLMRGEMHRLAMLVTDVAAFQPSVERQPVGRAAGRGLPVDVLGRPREQPGRPVGPALKDTLLLLTGEAVQVLVDRDEGFPFHLVVEVAQIGCAVGVGHDAVAVEAQSVGDPQAAVNEDEGD